MYNSYIRTLHHSYFDASELLPRVSENENTGNYTKGRKKYNSSTNHRRLFIYILLLIKLFYCVGRLAELRLGWGNWQRRKFQNGTPPQWSMDAVSVASCFFSHFVKINWKMFQGPLLGLSRSLIRSHIAWPARSRGILTLKLCKIATIKQ